MNHKKIISLLIGIFILTGCAKEYSAEKDFYKASKIFAEAKNAEITTHGKLEDVYGPSIEVFQKIVDKYPTSMKTPEALFIIAWIQMKMKNFEQARASLQKIVSDFSQFGTYGSDARFQIGRIYEWEGQWKEAEEMYWDTAEYHPMQKKGLYAPIYVFLHYSNSKDKTQDALNAKQEAFIKAKEYYEGLLKKVGPIQVSANIQNYMALLYLAHGDWEKSREIWLDINKNYPNGSLGPLSLLAAADLTAQRNQPQEAIALYRKFLDKYPKSPFTKKALAQIGLVHLTSKNYEQARQWLQKALDQYEAGKEPEQQAGIELFMAKSYQNEGKWEEAEKAYRELQKDFPKTDAALQVPMLIWTYYHSKGETQKADAAFKEGVSYFERFAQDYPQSRLARTARRYRNFLYGQKGDWNQVVANLDQDMANEKRTELKGNWLFEKAVITEKQLQDKPKAIDVYQNFLTHFPNHRLAGMAKTRLEVLTKK